MLNGSVFTLSWMMFVWALVLSALVLAIIFPSRPAWVPVADIDDGAALFARSARYRRLRQAADSLIYGPIGMGGLSKVRRLGCDIVQDRNDSSARPRER